MLAADRQPDFESGFAGAGFEFNFATVTVADDAVADDEAKTSARADCLRREKGLEHARLDLRRNAGAVVHDFDDQLIVFQRSANADLPGAIDGMNRVIDQIAWSLRGRKRRNPQR